MLGAVASRYDATTSQVALNWLINFNGDSVLVIPGASSPEQAGYNVASMDFRLSKDDLAYLDELSAVFKHRGAR